MTASTIAAGVNSIVKIDGDTFTAATSVETNIEKERIDVTGFGASARVYVMGLTSAREFTVRTYADAADAAVGDSKSIEITIAGDDMISGTAVITGYSSSADIDGASVHELTLLM